MSSTAVRRTERLIVREVEGETVVYDLDSEMVTVLDAQTAAIWDAVDGKASVAGIARKLSTSQDEVAVALLRLEDAGLLAGSQRGMSRRTMLKGLGVGAAVVPLLTMMAPAPAFAASGAALIIEKVGCTTGGNPRTTFRIRATGFDPYQNVTVAWSATRASVGTALDSGSVVISIGADGTGTSTTITIGVNNTPTANVSATTSEPKTGGTRSASGSATLSSCGTGAG